MKKQMFVSLMLAGSLFISKAFAADTTVVGIAEVIKDFSAKAAALGFEHNILEGFWEK